MQGRQLERAGGLTNGFGPGAHMLVGEQRHGCRFAGAMALLAVFLEQGLDVFMKNRRGSKSQQVG